MIRYYPELLVLDVTIENEDEYISIYADIPYNSGGFHRAVKLDMRINRRCNYE